MTNKRQIANWIKQIDKRMESVATERDKLDDMITSLEDLNTICLRAYDSLQEARDALSELV